LHAHLYDSGRAKFLSATDEEALTAHLSLAKLGGSFLHWKVHMLACIEFCEIDKEDKVVVCLSGRGDKDLWRRI
jgi:tryptophan synthase beta chain